MLAADALHFLLTFQRPLLGALAFACNPPHGLPTNRTSSPSVRDAPLYPRDASLYPQVIALRLLHCISSKSASMLPEDFLSFLLTMHVGGDPISTPPAGPMTSEMGVEAAADPDARTRGSTTAASPVGEEGGKVLAAWAARGQLLKVLQACMTQSQSAGEGHQLLRTPACSFPASSACISSKSWAPVC